MFANRSIDGVMSCRRATMVTSSIPKREAVSTANGTTSRSTPCTNTAAERFPESVEPIAAHGTASFRFVRFTGGSTGSNRAKPIDAGSCNARQRCMRSAPN